LQLAETLTEKRIAEGKRDLSAIGQAAIDNALALVEKWPRVRPANDRPYTRDVTKLILARKKLADAIELMQSE
jgi:hypothetical protein